jgi:hypothetical protein
MSRTPSISITPSITRTPSISITPTITVSPSYSQTPSISISTTATPSVTPSVTPSTSIVCTNREYYVSNSGTFFWKDCNAVDRNEYFPTGTLLCVCNVNTLPISFDGGAGYLTGGGCTCQPPILPSPTPSVTPSITRTPSITPTITPSVTPTPSITPTSSPIPCECWTVVNEDTVTINYTVTNCNGTEISPNLIPGARFNHCIKGGSIIYVNSPEGGLLGEYNCETTCTQGGGQCSDCGPAPTPSVTPSPSSTPEPSPSPIPEVYYYTANKYEGDGTCELYANDVVVYSNFSVPFFTWACGDTNYMYYITGVTTAGVYDADLVSTKFDCTDGCP